MRKTNVLGCNCNLPISDVGCIVPISPLTQFLCSTGAIRKLGRNQAIASQPKVARTISVKDVIAVLEREPQMAKSSLIYRLYNKVRSETSGE